MKASLVIFFFRSFMSEKKKNRVYVPRKMVACHSWVRVQNEMFKWNQVTTIEVHTDQNVRFFFCSLPLASLTFGRFVNNCTNNKFLLDKKNDLQITMTREKIPKWVSSFVCIWTRANEVLFHCCKHFWNINMPSITICSKCKQIVYSNSLSGPRYPGQFKWYIIVRCRSHG